MKAEAVAVGEDLANQLSSHFQTNKKRPYISAFDFSEYSAFLPEHKKQKDTAFLEWFLGFSEGDGCFVVKEGRPCFNINQADLGLLNKIRTNLGFGSVRNYTQKINYNRELQESPEYMTYARYSVSDRAGVRRFIAIFNGNIQLAKVQKRFEKWVECYNKVFKDQIIIKSRRLPEAITLETDWLAGFFDSEGGFSLTLRKHSGIGRTAIRFEPKCYVDQQFEYDIMRRIADLFNVRNVLVRDATEKFYRVEICSKISLKIACDYFAVRKLKGQKTQVYAIWHKSTNLYINDLHLSRLQALEKPVKRVKELNAAYKKVRYVIKLLANAEDSLQQENVDN